MRQFQINKVPYGPAETVRHTAKHWLPGGLESARFSFKKYLNQICLPALLALATSLSTPAQAPPDDLSKLSVEDLMNVEVTSASRKEQKLSRVAAAVFVISQEDIRRSGALNIPDLLRMVPGLDVAQMNGHTWAISSRGFNGQYSNKLLVVVDGRTVYTPTFAGVYWDALDVPLENIERIEVIRGPGGTVWGANAVNGVISIFTKKAQETQGLLLEAGGGTINEEFGMAQFGGNLNPGTQYRSYAKYFNNGPLLGLDGQSGGDGWHVLSGGFRVDGTVSPRDEWMVEGTIYSGEPGQYVFSQRGVEPQASLALHEQPNEGGGTIQSEWLHTHSDHADSALQLSFSRYVNGIFERETNNRWALDYKYHMELGKRQDVVAGAGFNYTEDAIKGDFAVALSPSSLGLKVFNAFVQDEIALIPDRLYLTAGTKLEHDDYNGFEAMPSVRIAWEPSGHNTLWASISRALRTPSRADTNVTANIDSFPGPGGLPILLRFYGDPSFQNEALIAYEAGYRATVSDKLSLDLALYYNSYDHLQTDEPGALFLETTPLPAHLVEPTTNANLMHGNTRGIELAMNWKVMTRWTLGPGYALEQIHMQTYPTSMDLTSAVSLEHNAPHNSAQLRSHVELGRGLDWNTSAYFVGRLTYQGEFANSKVPAYTRLDTGLNWKIREGISMSLVGQNLLQDHHVEFLGTLGSVQSSEMKRAGYVKFLWTFH